MLLIKLTRRAGTKDPSLTEKEWSSLLSDMLLLQEKVYDCVSKETCYEVATLYQPLALFTCQYLNFHPFEVVFRYRDQQLQPGEKHWYLFNLRPNIFKCWMFKHTFYSQKQFKNSSLSEKKLIFFYFNQASHWIILREHFFQIFVQSLLCSGRPQNIQLAVNFIEQTAGGSDQKKVSGKPVAVSYRLDYNKSLELILLASQEYFDAAANLSDSSMELAR